MPDIRLRDMFREYRKAKGLSFRQMEERTGVCYNALWRFEEGRALDESAFSAIVKWLMSDLDDTDTHAARRPKAEVKAQ